MLFAFSNVRGEKDCSVISAPSTSSVLFLYPTVRSYKICKSVQKNPGGAGVRTWVCPDPCQMPHQAGKNHAPFFFFLLPPFILYCLLIVVQLLTQEWRCLYLDYCMFSLVVMLAVNAENANLNSFRLRT